GGDRAIAGGNIRPQSLEDGCTQVAVLCETMKFNAYDHVRVDGRERHVGRYFCRGCVYFTTFEFKQELSTHLCAKTRADSAAVDETISHVTREPERPEGGVVGRHGRVSDDDEIRVLFSL